MTTARKARFDIREAGPKVAAALGVLLAANVIFLLAAVQPKLKEVRRVEQEGAPEIQRMKDRESAVQAIESYRDALTHAESDLEHLRQDVLSTRSRRLIEIQLEAVKLARQFNVGLERMQYDNTVLPDEALERYAITLPLLAGYENLRKFIQAVEQSDKFLVIERVALDQSRDGGALLELNITLATYFDVPELAKDPATGRARRSA